MVMVKDASDFEKMFRVVGKYPERTQIDLWKEIRQENELPFGPVME